jgi:hypothetical protein
MRTSASGKSPLISACGETVGTGRGQGMKFLQLACIASALAAAPWFFPRDEAPVANASAPSAGSSIAIETTGSIGGGRIDHSTLEQDFALLASLPSIVMLRHSEPTVASNTPAADTTSDPRIPDLSYLVYTIYSETPPDERLPDTVLHALKDIPEGTPLEEIKRVSEVLGLDPTFMKTIAKIESDFDPHQRTGNYIGLYQLSNYEFSKYGSGDILDARDNAVAAAYKMLTEAAYFEEQTHIKATPYDLYLIHQQGIQGAAEHVSHPDRMAWQSMCATDEGHQKGEGWCKRAIWRNTLPAVQKVWKSVENMPSAAFVAMWHDRINMFYARFSDASANTEASKSE